MPVRVPITPVRSALALGFLAGMLCLPGCAQRGGQAMFRRLCGFEEAPVPAAASPEPEFRFAGMLPKFWTRAFFP